MVDLTDQSMGEIGMQGPPQVVDQSATRASSANIVNEAVTGVDASYKSYQGDRDKSALDGFRESVNTQAESVAQGKTKTRADSGLRVESELKSFIRDNPHLSSDARKIASSQLGFDPTGTENQLKFGTFTHGTGGGATGANTIENRKQKTLAVAQFLRSQGHNVSDETALSNLADVMASEVKEAQRAAKFQSRQYADTDQAWAYQKDKLIPQSQAALGAILAMPGSTDDKNLAVQKFGMDFLQGWDNEYAKNNTHEGVSRSPTETAKTLLKERLQPHLDFMTNSINSKDPKVQSLSISETASAVAEAYAATGVNYLILSAAATMGEGVYDAASRIIIDTEGDIAARNKALTVMGLHGLANKPWEEVAKLNAVRFSMNFPDFGKPASERLPSNQEEALSDDYVNSNVVDTARESGLWDTAAMFLDNMIDGEVYYRGLKSHSKQGEWHDLMRADTKSGKAVRGNLQSMYDNKFPQDKQRWDSFFLENREFKTTYNPDTQQIELDSPPRKIKFGQGSLSDQMTQHNQYETAQDIVNEQNTWGNFFTVGGHWRWMKMRPEHKGSEFSRALSEGSMAERAENIKAIDDPLSVTLPLVGTGAMLRDGEGVARHFPDITQESGPAPGEVIATPAARTQKTDIQRGDIMRSGYLSKPYTDPEPDISPMRTDPRAGIFDEKRQTNIDPDAVKPYESQILESEKARRGARGVEVDPNAPVTDKFGNPLRQGEQEEEERALTAEQQAALSNPDPTQAEQTVSSITELDSLTNKSDIEQVQRWAGAKVDGIIGDETRAAVTAKLANTTDEMRAEQDANVDFKLNRAMRQLEGGNAGDDIEVSPATLNKPINAAPTPEEKREVNRNRTRTNVARFVEQNFMDMVPDFDLFKDDGSTLTPEMAKLSKDTRIGQLPTVLRNDLLTASAISPKMGEAAIKNFQAKIGTWPDGKIGTKTISAAKKYLKVQENLKYHSEEQKFGVMRDMIANIETGGLSNKFIRTAVKDSNSLAFGPYQVTKTLAEGYLTQKPGIFTPEESAALQEQVDRQIVGGKVGGTADRAAHSVGGAKEAQGRAEAAKAGYVNAKGEVSDAQLEKFLEDFDYGGDFDYPDAQKAALKSAQEAILRDHYDRNKKSLLATAAEWHGGAAWKKSDKAVTKTSDYQDKALKYLGKL